MRRFRIFGLLSLVSLATLSLGVVTAQQVATVTRSADDACRATRTLGDKSEAVRERYFECFRRRGGAIGLLVRYS